VWEAEIRRIVVPSQPRRKCLQDPVPTEKKLGMMVAPVISEMAEGLK
jgi:hypothetical protein